MLFEELYDFAGQVRKVNIAKPDSAAPFAYADHIESESKKIFDKLEEKQYLKDLDREQFISEITNLSENLNALHPFREGNGRAVRLFLILLADYAGYLLDYSQVSANDIISSDKAAFNGDHETLRSLYEKIVT